MPLPDPQAVVTSYLAGHDGMRAELAPAPDDAELANVGAEVEAPYPMLRVLATPVGADNLRHQAVQELQLEVWGAPEQDGGTSPAELRRILYVALEALQQLTDADGVVGDAVLSHVVSTQPGVYLPDDGQPRYLAGVMVYVHAATGAA